LLVIIHQGTTWDILRPIITSTPMDPMVEPRSTSHPNQRILHAMIRDRIIIIEKTSAAAA
jgi:hypothetical protein